MSGGPHRCAVGRLFSLQYEPRDPLHHHSWAASQARQVCTTGSSQFRPLRQLLQKEQSSQQAASIAVVEATVQAVDLGSPSLLMLGDASTGEHPVGMYLPTSLARLCEGPHAILTGKQLRFA